MKFRKPLTVCYQLGPVYFTGSSSAATAIKGPKGKRGTLVDVGVRVLETFACDTTTAKVRLGSSSDADLYAELVIDDGTAVTNFYNTADDRDAIKGEALHADEQIEVSYVNSSDSGISAGVAEVYIIIDWY